MRINNIVNVIDTERACDEEGNLGPIIEIGLVTVDLKNRRILKLQSFPISDARETYIDSSNMLCIRDVEITPFCHKLTGWTTKKLKKQGKPFKEVLRILQTNHGLNGRLCVVDSENELFFTPRGTPPTLNISTIIALLSGNTKKGISLEDKLAMFGLEFKGRRHSAVDDAYNIAIIFTLLLKLLDDSALQKFLSRQD